MSRPENKDFILNKTFYLLLLKGYDGVSITDIQKETGMSRGIIYHYYKDKNELFQAAAEKYLITPFHISREDTKGFNISGMIKYILDRYAETSKTWRGYLDGGHITMANYNFLFYQMIQKDKMTSESYYRMRREERMAWNEAVERSLNSGDIRPVLSAEKITAHFILIVDGIWNEYTETATIENTIKFTRQILYDYYELLKYDF